MSDHEDTSQQDPQPKVEDAAAPINVKVLVAAWIGDCWPTHRFLFFFFLLFIGRDPDGRRSVFQDQKEHKAAKAPGGVCKQSGERCEQYQVRCFT